METWDPLNQTQERPIELLRHFPAGSAADSHLPDWTKEEWEAVVTATDRHRSVPLLVVLADGGAGRARKRRIKMGMQERIA